MKAWGYEDPNRKGFIKADHRTVVELDQDNVNNATRGLHLVTFIKSPDGFKVDRVELYDIWKNKKISEQCASFLSSLSPGTIVAGASGDEISKNISVCRDALTVLGVPAEKIAYRGAVAFVACVGKPDWTVYQIEERHKGPVLLTKLVTIKGGKSSSTVLLREPRYKCRDSDII